MNHTPRRCFIGGVPIQARFLITYFIYSLSSFPVLAQTHLVSHYFDHDVKMYSTEIVPGTSHESVMAGTVFEDINAYTNKVHFLHLDEDGLIVTSMIYDDPNYRDERAIDIVPAMIDGEIRYIITCLVRPDQALRNSYSDRIKILVVNLNGTIYAEDMIYEQEGRGLYPLHSIEHNGSLFICGYETTPQFYLGESPMTVGYNQRRAFVIKYDPTSMLLQGSLYIDHQYNFNNPPCQQSFINGRSPFPVYDHDVAMRLVPLIDGSGNIFVTGSVNGVREDKSSSGVFVLKHEQRSAIMNIVIDDNLNVISNNSFAERDRDKGEYGVGLVQHISSGKNYIIANEEEYAYGFHPNWFSINTVNSDFTFDTTGTHKYRHIHQEQSPAIQTISVPHGVGEEAGIGIAGLAGLFISNNCYLTHPEAGNINPFLLRALVSDNGTTINVTIDNWVSYICKTGTGDPFTMPNSFRDMGGEFSNPYFFSTFAARTSNTNDVILSAPKLNGFWWYGTLGLKSIRAKFDDFTLPNCDSAHSRFGQNNLCINDVYYTVGPFTGLRAHGGITRRGEIVCPVDVVPDYGPLNIAKETPNTTESYYAGHDTPCDINPPNQYYKKAPPIVTNTQQSISLYPNPAADEVSLRLEGVDMEATVKANVYNMQGQLIRNLFTGTKVEVQSPIDISTLPSGFYIVKVYIDGQMKANQKLVKK
jgi:hypothetical protein